ncbi:MAG: RDD family protein [Mycobacteriaceae bacterium]
MSDQPPVPPPGNHPPPPGNYPPPPGYQPPPPGYQPPPPGYYPPPGGYYPPPAMAGLPKEAYTPWFTRVVAYFIDALPVFALAGIGQGVMFGTAQNECISGSTDSSFDAVCTSQPSALGLTVSLVFGLAALAFAVWNYGYRQGTTGSSIGKSAMKFKVVGERTGLPIGFGLSILRQLAHIVDSLICYLGYLFPLWDAKRQTIADKIMSTVCLPL